MINFLIINMQFREENDVFFSYYYESDKFIEDYDSAGIIEFNKSILSDFKLEGDKLMYVTTHYLNGNIRVLRNATNSLLDNDGNDWIAILAMEEILTSVKETASYLKEMNIINQEMKELLTQEDFIEQLKSSLNSCF